MKYRMPDLVWVSWLSLHQSRCVTSLHPVNLLTRSLSTLRPPKTRRYSLREYTGTTNDNPNETLSIAEEAFSSLAKSKRTWRRLRHLVAIATSCGNLHQVKSIVDIGTDHGILPIALASTGSFEKVLGIDISEQVLRDGALALHKQVQEHLESQAGSSSMSPIEFRLGDGLKDVQTGDADFICIAGMGVNTMLKIVAPSETDRVGCQLLILQPTNSKPKNLIHLYDTLQNAGWKVLDERIEYLTSHWYMSVAFSKPVGQEKSQIADKLDLPGICLQRLPESTPMKQTFNEYVDHHLAWLEKDKELPTGLHESEVRWLSSFDGR